MAHLARHEGCDNTRYEVLNLKVFPRNSYELKYDVEKKMWF